MNSISVIVPVYNRGARVQKTLDSIITQTLAPLEIIVVDDGSTDGSADWIERHYGESVRVLRQSNGGVARARNVGLQEAQGEYIAFCDHDDEWLPEKLKKQAQLFESHPRAGVVYCFWSHVENGNQALDNQDLRVLKSKYGFPRGQVFNILVRANFIISMSVPLIKTNLLREIGGFDSNTEPCDDWDVWLRLSRFCEFERVEEVLMLYMHHDTQQSANEEKMWRAASRALSKHRSALLKQPKTLWIVLSYRYFLKTLTWYRLARVAIGRGDWNEVRRQLILCFIHRPLMIAVPQWLYIFKRLIMRDARPF